MLIILLLTILIPLIAQLYIKTVYNKYMNVKNSTNTNGEDTARKILGNSDLYHIDIQKTPGILTDYYDPKRKKLSLSSDVISTCSIASMAIAAHECGHAIQDKEGYTFLKFRNKLVPVVNFTSKFAIVFILLGFTAEFARLYDVGIILMSAGVFFQLITLPVEINASNRAKELLIRNNIINTNEISGITSVLNAAAMTYVAGLFSSILEIARLVFLRRNN